MPVKKVFTSKQAQELGAQFGIDWTKFAVEELRYGMDVELEHGSVDPETNVTNDNPLVTAKIAYVHLKEYPDYYVRLRKMEEEAEEFWEGKG